MTDLKIVSIKVIPEKTIELDWDEVKAGLLLALVLGVLIGAMI